MSAAPISWSGCAARRGGKHRPADDPAANEEDEDDGDLDD